MNSILFLFKYSGASSRTFWIGTLGKIMTELLPIVCWLILFNFLLGNQNFSSNFNIILLISISIIGGQWLLAQLTEKSFIGAFDMTHNLRKMLLRDLRSQPLSTLKGKGLGEKINLITKDLKIFEDIFSHLMTDFIASWVIPIAMTSIIFSISPLIGSILIVIIVSAWIVLLLFEKSFIKAADNHQKINIDCANKTLEYIDCLPMLKSFGQSNKLAKPLCDQIEALRKSGLGLEWAGGIGVVFALLLLELSIPIIALIGSNQMTNGTLTNNEWLVVVIAGVACIRPFVNMTVFSTLLRYMFNSAKRLHGLANSEQQPREGVPTSFYNINLTNITLILENKYVLRDINIDIKQGEHIAIIGTSGAGKSSLLDIIAAFHIPTHGSLKIGDKTLKQIGTLNWYQKLSYVTQQVELFSGSLRDNLLIANKNSSEVDLQQVIEQVGLEELVSRLPEGLENNIGENGNELSGGERQRLSVARALLKNSPIILLDEITSALDPQRQKQIMGTLKEFCRGKTVITVAHRLNTIIDADRIYLLENGKIKEAGNHNELMDNSNHYQKLWQNQKTSKTI